MCDFGVLRGMGITTQAIGGEPIGEPTPCDSAFVSSAEPAEQAKREPGRSERANRYVQVDCRGRRYGQDDEVS